MQRDALPMGVVNFLLGKTTIIEEKHLYSKVPTEPNIESQEVDELSSKSFQSELGTLVIIVLVGIILAFMWIFMGTNSAPHSKDSNVAYDSSFWKHSLVHDNPKESSFMYEPSSRPSAKPVMITNFPSLLPSSGQSDLSYTSKYKDTTCSLHRSKHTGHLCREICQNNFRALHRNTNGLFNSGTNVMGWMIHQNCKDQLNEYGDWKHKLWLPSMIGTYPKTKYIIMVRDPYTWMESMCKKSYDMIGPDKGGLCQERVLNDWGFPCYRDMEEKKYMQFRNLVELWNVYYGILMELNSRSHRFVRLEDYLWDPEVEMTKVCRFLGGTIGNFSLITKPAKKHGHSNGLKKTRENYLNRGWWISNETRAEICGLLDPRVLTHFNYTCV